MTPGDLLVDLASCLCAEFTPTGGTEPDLCFCDVAPGQTFAHDYVWECDDKCGAAWVRLANAYPAVGVGVPAENRIGCGALLGFDIEIGVIRCLEQESTGEAPPAETMSAAALTQVDDLIAMRRAVMCCDALKDEDYSLNTYQPVGPQGMVVGGTWTLSVVL